MFDEKKLSDPGYYRENRLEPHTDHAYYLTEAEREELRARFHAVIKVFS